MGAGLVSPIQHKMRAALVLTIPEALLIHAAHITTLLPAMQTMQS